jgi:hypothetical protein
MLRTYLRGFTCTFLMVSNVSLADDSKKLEVRDICAGLSIQEEVWHRDPQNGRIIDRLGPINIYRFGAGAEKSSNQDPSGKAEYACRMGNSSSHRYGDEFGEVHSAIEAKVGLDGKITLEVSQFAATQRGKKGRKNFDKPIRQEIFDISDLKSVQWRSESHSKGDVFMRFVPMLGLEGAPREASQLAIAGRDMIVYDNRQTIWSENLSFAAPFVQLGTHQGTIALSFQKFEGAEVLGDAKSRRMELRLPDGRLLSFVSETDFAPAGQRYIVYGRFYPGVKTDGPGSESSSQSSSREDFEKRLPKK